MLLTSARYTANPYQADHHRHQIPVEAFQSLFGSNDQTLLDGKWALFEILVVTPNSDQPLALPPLIIKPSSRGEPRIGKRLCPAYPDPMTPGAYLIVQVTPLP
jgi:hypothetical protein